MEAWKRVLNELWTVDDKCEEISSLIENVLEEVEWADYPEAEKACQTSLELLDEVQSVVRFVIRTLRRAKRGGTDATR